MIQLAECSDDEAARLTAFAYAAQSYLAADIYDTAYVYLGKGYDVWAEMKKDGLPESFYADPYSVFTLYNSFAIYAANSTMNYEKVTEYLTEGLSLAKRYFPGDGYAVMGSNLVLSYFLREDPDGLKYALEIYEDGLKNRNNRLVYAGGFGAALMYCLLEDYSNAEYYIKQSLDSGYDKADEMWVNTIYGNILYRTGRNEQAEICFRKALGYASMESAATTVFFYLSYGDFLSTRKRYRESLEIYKEGLRIAQASKNRLYTYRIHKSMAIACSSQGDWHEAFEHYVLYHEEYADFFNLERERAIGDLTLKYETALRDVEIQQGKLRIMKQERIIIICLAVLLIVGVALIVSYSLYKVRNRMYNVVIRQYRDAALREKSLKQKIEEMEKPIATDLSDQIFLKLEGLMQSERIYRDATLSRDRLAELTDTNRTYLTSIVKERTGKSIAQYINSYRVNHALGMLSGTEACSLKSVEAESGFYSSSTFFRIFKEETGMSPAKYRNMVEENARREKKGLLSK